MPERVGDRLWTLVDDCRDEIKAIVRRHHGVAVALFGSVARGEARRGSDLDFLVEIEPGARPIQILSIGVALEEVLGVPVDVVTLGSLRAEVRDSALAEAIWL